MRTEDCGLWTVEWGMGYGEWGMRKVKNSCFPTKPWFTAFCREKHNIRVLRIKFWENLLKWWQAASCGTLPVRLFSLKSLVGEDGFVDLAGLFRSRVSLTCIFCRHSASIERFSDHIEKFHWHVWQGRSGNSTTTKIAHNVTYAISRLKKTWHFPILSLENGSMLFTA